MFGGCRGFLLGCQYWVAIGRAGWYAWVECGDADGKEKGEKVLLGRG